MFEIKDELSVQLVSTEASYVDIASIWKQFYTIKTDFCVYCEKIFCGFSSGLNQQLVHSLHNALFYH